MIFKFREIVPKGRGLQAIGWASLLGCLALLSMPEIFRLDAKTHGDWLQFLGRFHPVAVHLPIGLILLVPLLEIVGRRRPALREAAGFVLWLSVPACIGSTLLGFLLAFGSGDAGVRVSRHMWAGIVLSVAVTLCAWLRAGWSSGMARAVYLWLLGGVIAILLWTTHQGGSLTHGDDYLTEHAPAALTQWPSMFTPREVETAAPGSFYAMQIRPIFDAKCVSCHGASKVKGKLRMDSYDRLMRGGEEGRVIVPGDAARSLLFQRVTLPPDHKKFMPTEGKPPLNASEIAIIKAWIEDGASPTAVSVPADRMKSGKP